jgi:DNA-binding NarL/FixJ family response regulator
MANAYVPPTVPPTSIRILVADDFEPWLRQVCSMLQTRPYLRVVADVGDGLEAVQKAKELQPDLIVLDFGLPTLNGLEAAKHIRELAPDSKMIFLTQHRDRDLVRAALSAGAQGYVLKIDAGRELFTAVEGVLSGDAFVSSGVEGWNSSETGDTPATQVKTPKSPRRGIML